MMRFILGIQQFLLFLAVSSLPALTFGYEGFGAVTSGADECSNVEVFHVTSLANSGSGTLRDALSRECRHIVFDVSGTISLSSTLRVPNFTTLDGSTAPDVPGAYGITLEKAGGDNDLILMYLDEVHDIIINNLRFLGEGTSPAEGGDNLTLVGVDRVVIDHVSSGYADDGAIDISWGWGSMGSQWANRNVTVSYSILYHTEKAMLIKYGPHHNITLHHNLFAKNQERNPQIRHQVEVLDFVNNIVYDWAYPNTWGYGLRIATQDPDAGGDYGGDGLIDMNIVGNIFLAGDARTPELAIYYLNVDGGTGELGELYYQDNILPSENRNLTSTVAGPLPIPAEAQVTTQAASDLPGHLLSSVGTKFRTPEEEALISEIAGQFGPRPMPPVLD